MRPDAPVADAGCASGVLTARKEGPWKEWVAFLRSITDLLPSTRCRSKEIGMTAMGKHRVREQYIVVAQAMQGARSEEAGGIDV